jgi:predicted type IV restriction endonuclease
MEDLLATLSARLHAAQFRGGEQAIRETVVLPILQALGWDVFDPASVVREYSLSTRRVDYALSVSPPAVNLLIEVKALGNSDGADRQLFEYAYHEGVQFAVLTDGREWNFYVPGEQGSYDERRVQKLDLVEPSPKDSVSILTRYLARNRVQSGKALESAKADYKSNSSRRIAANNIFVAWKELVELPDDLLLDLIAEKTKPFVGSDQHPKTLKSFWTP